MISGMWITALVPLLMLAGFVFVDIPVLDAHLHEHYGAAFDVRQSHAEAYPVCVLDIDVNSEIRPGWSLARVPLLRASAPCARVIG